MDPALQELLLAEEAVERQALEAIIRFRRLDCVVPGVRVVASFGHVATCRVAADRVAEVRRHPDVVSLKAPRRLGPDFDEAGTARRAPRGATRPTDVRRGEGLALTGAGVVVGVVDWGLDIDFPSFKNPDGTTRLLALWDQRDSATGTHSGGYGYGAVHDHRQINEALRSGQPYTSLGYHPGSSDKGTGSHGTHVTDIAAGNGRGGGPRGVASGADLVFVHLADRGTGGLANLGDSVRLLEGIDFIARTAGQQPWVVNLSVGRHGGPHDGSTLTELALDELLCSASGRFIVQSTGNYYQARTHARGVLARGERRTLTFRTDPADTTTNELELWYDGNDRFAVHVRPPGGATASTVRLDDQVELRHGDQVIGRVYHRACDPNNGANHLDAFLYPHAPAGDWRVTLEAEHVRSGRFDAWLERDEACRHCQSRFAPGSSDPECTTGTIANSRVPLVVGAYDGHDPARRLAPFSSAGPTRDGRTKPDLVAPGMQVLAARSATTGDHRSPGLLVRKSGSSMAAPHLTGAVALCLQAGGDRLDAARIRQLVLGTATPPATATTAADRARLGAGFLDLPALTTAARRHFLTCINRPTVADPREHTMQSELDSEHDAVARLMQAPARAYRELMYRPNGELARWIGDRFDVVGPPGRPLTDAPRPGDVFLRVVLGSPGGGRCAVLDRLVAGPSVMPFGELLLRPYSASARAAEDAENRTPVPVDTLAAVPPFRASERVRVVTPLLTSRASTEATAWNTSVHPATSGVILDEIRSVLSRYVDPAAVQAAIQGNQRDPARPIDASSPSTDAVLVESIHQFQMKCYLDRTEHDGRAGESTLDSLGLIARSGRGMRQSDRAHPGAQRRLRARDAQVRAATGSEFSADNWFDQMCDPSVIGVRTKLGRGLHVALVRRLRTAERHLLTLPAFQGLTPVALAAALGLAEKHGGARPTQTNSTSVHTFGLAVDISYTGNPWVRRAATWAALRRAAALVSGVTLRQGSAPAYFSSLGSDPARSTVQVWDELRQRSSEMVSYVGLRSDVAALRAALAAARGRGTPGLFEPGETLDAAVGRWRTQIDRDRRELMAGDFYHHDPPERGFLTHHRDLVIALRDHGCLAWGAVDLGPGASGSGDVMHFDMRVDGVGRVLTVRTAAFVPTAGHPCVTRPAQGATEMFETDTEDTTAFVATLQRIWDRMFGKDTDLAKVRIHALKQAPSNLIANSGYAAWTNSPTAVYVAPNPRADTTYWEVVLHHESLHVKQFLDAKRKPPQLFETMMDYECKAYSESHRWFAARKLRDPSGLAKQLKATAAKFCTELKAKHSGETAAQREERFKKFLIRNDLLPGDVRLTDLYAPTEARYRNPDKAESAEATELGDSVEDAESRVHTAKATIRTQATRWGTDEAAILAALRALTPAETAQVLADGATIDTIVSELSGAELTATAGLLARGRVAAMARTDVSRILADPTRYPLGTLGAAAARDVLLGHQEAFDRTGTGTVHGSHCPIARPAGATTSDCTEYVKDVLARTFGALGRADDWTAALAEATRRSRPSGLKGTEVIRALQTLQGWQAVFWSPDPIDPSDGDQEHPYAYRIARRDGAYYRIRVDRNRSVVNYRRTNAANPTDSTGIDRLRRLQFGVLAARGGMHMAMVINAEVYEVHWSSPATDRNAVEATPLVNFAWLSGAIAAPAGDIDLAWRTP